MVLNNPARAMSDSEGMRVLIDFLKRLADQTEEGYNPIMVWDLTPELCEKFDEKIVKPFYPHPTEAINIGRSKAIRDLMRKAIEEKEKKEKKEKKA